MLIDIFIFFWIYGDISGEYSSCHFYQGWVLGHDVA